MAIHWYVVQTKPKNEERVIQNLARRSVEAEVFLPKIEVMRRRRTRRWTALEPLFPNYLFVRTEDNARAWSTIRWTPGVRRLLGNEDVPAPIPDELVDTIRQRTAEHGFVRVPAMPAPGTRVRVKGGPFDGLEGILERPTSRAGRVRVLLTLVQRHTPIEVDILDLER
ncbi:MAG: hypothetical protein HY660_01710, partial [Armatimonadetes bacterium]|nr:hypothetical protein [Armatimonadota bacterium]